jgi:hypothetical protein
MEKQIESIFSIILKQKSLDALPIGITNMVSTFSKHNVSLISLINTKSDSQINEYMSDTKSFFSDIPGIEIVLIPAIFMYKNEQLVKIFADIFNVSDRTDFSKLVNKYVDTVILKKKQNMGQKGGVSLQYLITLISQITLIIIAICGDYAYYTQLTRSVNKYKDGEATKVINALIAYGTGDPICVTQRVSTPSTSQQIFSLMSRAAGIEYDINALNDFLNCYSINPNQYYEDLAQRELLNENTNNVGDTSSSLVLVSPGELVPYKESEEVNKLLSNINTQLVGIKNTGELSEWINKMSLLSTDDIKKTFNIETPSTSTSNSGVFGEMLQNTLGEEVIKSGKLMTKAVGILVSSLRADLQATATATVNPVDAVWRIFRDKIIEIKHDFATKRADTERFTQKIVNEISDFMRDLQSFTNMGIMLMGMNMAAAYAGLNILKIFLNNQSNRITNTNGVLQGGKRQRTKRVKKKRNNKKYRKTTKRGKKSTK